MKTEAKDTASDRTKRLTKAHRMVADKNMPPRPNNMFGRRLALIFKCAEENCKACPRTLKGYIRTIGWLPIDELLHWEEA